ncbi:MAG: ABC transporter permease [Ruminococcus sp.]|jgi:putative ABC transport system permease protein
MLTNNNRKIIKRMAVSSLKSNKGRNLIVFLSVVLASFMLFSIFTVGITYFKMLKIQNIRLNGGDYDAIMYGVTPEQMEKCESNPDISRTGVLAMSGYIESTQGDNTVEASCIWADSVCWEEFMAPAREWVRGTYPREDNEVMVTEEGLEKAGLAGLTVGDSFQAEYRDGKGNLLEKKFTISGIWDGYGTKSAFYVSETFYQESGCDISEAMCGRYHIDFNRKIMTNKEQQAFIASMHLGKQQALFFTSDLGYSLPIFFGLCGLVLVTCLCAYLLIYNILYLSVSGNVRYYGLLQTVGMTGRQIRFLIRRQMLILGGSGVLFGLLAGSAVSFFLFPSVIRFLGIHTEEMGEIHISMNPAVLLLTIGLTAVTVYLGSRKSVKLAVSISPLEAVGYRPVRKERGSRRTKKGGLIFRMALDQILKDKKKSLVVMISLAAGLSVFLCISTLLESQAARTIVANHMNNDMTIVNDTLKKEDGEEHRDLLTADFLEKLKTTEGVSAVYPMVFGQITVPWEPDFADLWMKEFYAKWMSIPYEDEVEEYREHPENFGSVILGISKEELPYLQETLDTEINQEDFLAGKTCVLYQNGLDLTMEDLKGKEVTCEEYGNSENTRTFQIAGLTGEGYYSGPVLGYPPTIIVYADTVKNFIGSPLVSKTGVKYAKEFDETAEEKVIALIQSSPDAADFSWESKLESLHEVKRAQGNMKEVGLGIALILALIGILNYVNTVTGNIQSRQSELAILESVGMTDRQRNRMLVIEGLLFAAGSLLLTATAGLGITYAVYQSMNYMQVPFAVPMGPAAVMAAFIIGICMAIPLAAGRRMIKKGSVVERIRGL